MQRPYAGNALQYDAADIREMQNGSRARFHEEGTTGLNAWGGYLSEAYLSELEWPSVQPTYDRIRRAVPQVAMTRQTYSFLLPQTEVAFEPATDTPADREAADFGNEVLDDMDGGIQDWIETAVSQVPFFGWGWWSEVLARRDPNWRPPDRDDAWRSEYDDGRIGIRRLAFRDTSSFWQWAWNDASTRLQGMEQHDPPNDPIVLPLDRSVHVTFGGDRHNPEGLTPLESVYRLERYMRNLEMIQGFGFQNAAGYLSVDAEKEELTSADKRHIKAMARAVMTPQEGNFAAWPKGFTGELKSVPFNAAPDILKAIRYYGLLILQLFNMHWVAVATTAETGAFSAKKGDISMFVLSYNSMLKGFIRQLDDQFGRRLYEEHNPDAFDYTERPRLKLTRELTERVALNELGTFWQVIQQTMDVTEEDILAVRRHSGILPETVPEEDADDEPEPEREDAPPDVSQDDMEPEPTEAHQRSYWFIELQDPQIDDVTRQAESAADELQAELRQVYLDWLDEAETRLDATESERDRREELAALLLLLRGRVRNKMELQLSILADSADVDATARGAMREQLEQTIEAFENRTIPDIEAQMQRALVDRDVARAMDVDADEVPSVRDALKGKAAHVGLAGGAVWSAFQAAKQASAHPTTLARWVGPERGEPGVCEPCAHQMDLGERPVSQVPIPGPAVCDGLNNCRHDIEYYYPKQDEWLRMPPRREDLE